MALRAVLAATRAGLCRVDSMMFSLLPSRLRRVRPRTMGVNAELLCVLSAQSLPAAELHGLGAGDAPNRLASQKPIQHIEADVPARGAPRDETAVDVVPQRQACAAANGFK